MKPIFLRVTIFRVLFGNNDHRSFLSVWREECGGLEVSITGVKDYLRPIGVGTFGLVVALSFSSSTGFASTGLPAGSYYTGRRPTTEWNKSMVPGPYVALREIVDSDSSDVISSASSEPGRGVRYKPVLFSALLPGSGQIYQGQNRGYLYIATEVASIAGWMVFRNKGKDVREEYIDFAWVNARENISSHNVRGDDDYYEHIARWIKSGEFDADRNYDLDDPFTIDPWTESGTWNGEQWRIATINYFEPDSSGEYTIGTRADSLAALQYYAGRAYQEDFYWDWTNAGLEPNALALQNQYLDLRDESNLAFQHATLSLVVLMANHVVSVIDAFISAKIELPGGEGDNRTKFDLKFKGGPKMFPGGSVRLTHEF